MLMTSIMLLGRQGGKNANRMPDRGKQVSVTAQENLKLDAFLFDHRWICIFDWVVAMACEDTVHLLAGNEYKDP